MAHRLVKIDWRPTLSDARMVMALSGWMDGGETSTGTVEYLVEQLRAEKFAEIEPEEFYIYNFPGSMEVSALFRPHTKIEDGLITTYEEPANTFYCSQEHRLVLFKGKEPNLRWSDYAECVLSVAAECNVRTIYFVGSVAGLIPHTRDPKFHGSVSDEGLGQMLQQHGVHPTNYEGPASIVTYLTMLARQRGMRMATLVAEVPAYIQGKNPKAIGAAAGKLAAILGLRLELDNLKALNKGFEKSIAKLIEDQPELAEHIHKMEEHYDKEELSKEMAELKEWFERQGVRLD